MLRKGISLIMGLALLCLCACQNQAPNSQTPSATPGIQPTTSFVEDFSQEIQVAESFIQALAQSQWDDAFALCGATMQTGLGQAEALRDLWSQILLQGGVFEGITDQSAKKEQEYCVVLLTISFQRQIMVQRVVIGMGNRMVEGYFIDSAENRQQESPPLPDTLTETDVAVNAGAHPLAGKITQGVNPLAKTAGLVLVHGSGPQDMDESVGANAFFRQLAYALAGPAVTVLRYDKRTYIFPPTSEEQARFTVKEETVDDAAAAVKFLRARDDVEKVFIVGHSLGGMLAPRIAREAGADGMIILAGSPRKLWEILYDQNIDAIQGTQQDTPENRSMLEKELEKAQTLSSLSKEELAKTRVFSLPAYYLYEMDSVDPLRVIQELAVPVFILQGGADFQIKADTDFAAFQAALKQTPSVRLSLYPGLNHLFMPVSSDPNVAGTINDYNIPGEISADVIQDILDWIQLYKS